MKGRGMYSDWQHARPEEARAWARAVIAEVRGVVTRVEARFGLRPRRNAFVDNPDLRWILRECREVREALRAQRARHAGREAA